MMVISSTLNFTSSTIKHAKYNRHSCMTEECSKCIKAFGKLFRPIVVSNVNALPQQASVFMRIFYLLMGLVETRDNTAKKTAFRHFLDRKLA